MAAQENHLEVVKFLLDNGASQSLATEVRHFGSFYGWVQMFIGILETWSCVIENLSHWYFIIVVY